LAYASSWWLLVIGVGVDLYGHPMSFGDFLLLVLMPVGFIVVGMWATFVQGWTSLGALMAFFAIGGVLYTIWTALAWLVNVSA
jgi:hypothetical protein